MRALKRILLALCIALYCVVSAGQAGNASSPSSPSSPVGAGTQQKQKQKQKLFYLYNLTEEFWWRWPRNGTEASCRENGYLGHEHAELSGLGRLINEQDGLFLTWHFSMFSSLFNRLKRSRRRTLDPSAAELFIIPYDIGLDGYMNAATCKNRMQCSQGLVGKLLKQLGSMPYFRRHGGADHVVLWSLGQYHPWPRAGCDLFMKEHCARCTITCYWMDPTKAESRFVSLPFPSGYHWTETSAARLPWSTSSEALAARNLTAVYLGSTQTLNPAHTKIRRAMAAQCNASADCHWLRLTHSSIDGSIAELLSVYRRATFCLCPPGDDPARKAVFDALVSGCIPVIFEVATLYNQYPWHIGEAAALDVSVYIPGGAVRASKIDLMAVLRAVSPEVVRAKQEALRQLAPRVQYAAPPLHLLADRLDETAWEPPFADAAAIALDGFFARTSSAVRNLSTGIPHRLMSGREWGAEYDAVKVQVPRAEGLAFGQQVNSRPQQMHMHRIPSAPTGPSADGATSSSNKGRGKHHGHGHGHQGQRAGGRGSSKQQMMMMQPMAPPGEDEQTAAER